MKSIQLIGITPEQMSLSIVDSLKSNLLEELKKEFQPKEPEEYLTRKEVSKLLKVDLSTLYLWTKKGKLKSYGIGNRVFYKRSELENSIVELKH